jgi:hypothetical protein
MEEPGEEALLELEEAPDLLQLVADVVDSRGAAAGGALPRWKQIVSAGVLSTAAPAPMPAKPSDLSSAPTNPMPLPPPPPRAADQVPGAAAAAGRQP